MNMTIQTNVIHCGDNLEIMCDMDDESVDLIYLDPPFFSNRDYELIWGDDQETQSFGDRWEGGIEHYVGWMSERLREMHRILKPTGSIYLHVDWHAVHYLKVEMDKIFGYGNFQNEIVWHYPNKIGKPSTSCKRAHDNILFYSKSNDYVYNPILVEIDNELTLKRYDHEDENGVYKIYHTGGVDRKVYLKPKVSDDVWNINALSANNSERLGYPTQKPEVLLDRIIKASSNEDDIVFDPFCGCGTALAVAKKLGRQYIGIDVSPTACPVVADRLGVSSDQIIGMPISVDDLKTMDPNHFQQWVCTQMNARNTSPDASKNSGGDGGVDGIVKSTNSTTGYTGAPIQIKRNTKKPIDVNVVKNFFATMHDKKKDKGFIVALSFGKGAVEQVAKYKNEGSVEIILVKAEDIAEKGYFEP
ncbi:MAG: site-specific DNA-methyltransferase [Euryarchaeota archaeon]|nr:site-specific DNA-methyltransferase [Euryarchaeota archaeon]